MNNQKENSKPILNNDYKPLSTKLQIEFNFVLRRIRLLSIAISLGIVIIFFIGLFTPVIQGENESDVSALLPLKIISLIVCISACVSSYPLKSFLLKKVSEKNFMSSYFNAIILPMALCDFGGLFCIVTNSFLLDEKLFSTVGFIISLLYIYLNFPSLNDLKKTRIH